MSNTIEVRGGVVVLDGLACRPEEWLVLPAHALAELVTGAEVRARQLGAVQAIAWKTTRRIVERDADGRPIAVVEGPWPPSTDR